MKITSIKTELLVPGSKSLPTLEKFLLNNVKELNNKDVLAISSKILSVINGNVVKAKETDKQEIAKQQADQYYVPSANKYCQVMALKHNLIMPAAGIDESNAKEYLILLPEDPQALAKQCHNILLKQFKLNDLGIIITDSKTSLLRRGTTGVAIAYYGFSWKRDYVNKPDLFNRKMKVTQANLVDALATAAVVVMGEGKEQTPIIRVQEIENIMFNKKLPNKDELDEFFFSPEQDIYYDLIANLNWQKKK